MRVLIFVITFIVFTSQVLAEELTEDIMDEWDNKEIELNRSLNENRNEIGSDVQHKHTSHTRVKKITKTNKNKPKTAKKNKPRNQASPITRPILYRYIYINPKAEQLKAKERLIKEEQKKAIREEQK